MSQGDNFLDGYINIKVFPGHRRLLEERPHFRNHVTGSIAITNDATNRLPSFIDSRRPPRQPTQAGTGIAHDRGQRLIDLMRDGRGQLAQSGYSGDMSQLRLRSLQGLLAQFALSYV